MAKKTDSASGEKPPRKPRTTPEKPWLIQVAVPLGEGMRPMGLPAASLCAKAAKLVREAKWIIVDVPTPTSTRSSTAEALQWFRGCPAFGALPHGAGLRLPEAP
jgi:hypothetical protein